MSNPILKLENVSYCYNPGQKEAAKAVNQLSLAIEEGETFGLVGESGCGKTTTGKMIVKLLEPTEGKIYYQGQDIGTLRKRSDQLYYRKQVQMIFQDPYASLDPRMKVKDILSEGMKIHHLYQDSEKREQRVAELLNTVGLQRDHATRYPHEFSGGQRQRIGIARALALEPKLIVCDEPISALDVSVQAQIVNLLKKLQQQKNLTMLFIAHDLSMVKVVSDRIGVMCAGQLVELGSSDAVYDHPLHPYTQSLISAIPLPDPILERKRQRIHYTPAKPDHPLSWQEKEPGHFVLI